jgi:subtilisin-like proprotein convertase family protein
VSTFSLTDPLLPAQWYLINTGQRGGDSRLDINVLPAWQAGFNGSGIVVAINDDGIDLTHPDLVGNIDATKVYDTNRDTTGQGLVGTDNSHGTVVGSIVGMAANGTGGVGVAYKATLVPALAIGSTVAFASANLFKANIAARVDVSVNSWGADPAFAENFGASGPEEDQAWGTELLRAATQGRNGLGMVIEVSAGNERANRADAGLSNFTGNKVTIAVGSVDENGVATDYSTPGASLLLTAFGGRGSESQADNRGFGAVSADIVGSGGYNTTAGDDGDYAYQNQGTSYSGPMVGAAAALILQANPQLGFRDVSAILAMTARQTDPGSQGWKTNGSQTWNLGGMHFSRDYGYGLLDVAAAVRLAQGWIGEAGTAANWVSATSGPMTTQTLVIPDDASKSLTVTTQVADAVRIDRMEFDLNLTALSPSQLKAVITSPSGTTITLFDQPLTRPLKDGEPDSSVTETSWPGTFTIGSTAFLGESSQGTWTLKLIDLVTGVEATFNSLTVRAWGSAASTSDQYVLTNEFKGTKKLTDTSGTDTLNAAAMDRAVTLDLAGVSRFGADATITLAQGTVIENAVGSWASDFLQGNDVANLLRGLAGDDTLSGGAGNDTLDGGNGTDTAIFGGARLSYTITWSASASAFTVSSAADGTDTLTGVETLTFSDGSVSASSLQTVAGVMAGGAGNDRIQGTLNDDQVDGGPGLDGFVVNATRASTQVERLGSDTVQLKGPNGKDSLKNVERILFTDSALAFDLSGNAGTVARILGSVFGPGAISNKEYAGIGLQLIDAGMGYEALMNLALDAALGASRSDMAVVQLLYRNLVGSVPTSGDAAYFVGLITSGAYSQVGLAQYAASLTLTEERINLIGLAQSGLAYTPPDGG